MRVNPRFLRQLLLLVAAIGLLAGCFEAAPDGWSTVITCPVTGPVRFTNDWHAPRAGGLLHEGNDIFAPRGTWNVAAVDGRTRISIGERQGNGLWLTGRDGTQYFYAHFDAYWGGERDVVAGELIGFTGNTGDAQFTDTHTHFEIHPNGGPAVNPYPTLVASCLNRTSGADSTGTTAPVDGFAGAAPAGVPTPR
jgi:murein DD-endopeptidase MepM/ murein hydrolase activator NlpD